MRHAFCIMAFNDYEQLMKMLEILDSEKSDFYIHINAKVEMPDCEKLKSSVHKSNVYFTQRVPIVWGENGVLTAELVLLETAVQHGDYDYYHMLSGQDFPLKSLDELDAFLEDNINSNMSDGLHTNYIDARVAPDRVALERFIHYNWLIKYWRHPIKAVRGLIRGINLLSHYVQRILHVNRLNIAYSNIFYGSVWFSITEPCARYICQNKEWFEKYFSKHSFAPDEGAIQTLIMKSQFKTSIYITDKNSPRVNLRYDDYIRGNGASPYVFRMSDIEELRDNKNFFARKFSASVDVEVVDKLYESITKL